MAGDVVSLWGDIMSTSLGDVLLGDAMSLHPVNAMILGSCHDSTLFKGSLLGRKIVNGIFGNGFLLEDSDCPCATFSLTPYEKPSTPKEVVIGE